MTKNAVEVRDLTVKFGDFTAVKNVSFSIPEGKIYGLLGPNGAGKTTIIRAISTLLPFESGSISVFGVDVASKPGNVRNLIGLAGQYAAVDEALTGMQNLEMIGRLYHLPGSVVKSRAVDILKRLGLTDAANKRVKAYSGGMRRRLDLGACLIGQAKFILLDEPTTGLDPRTRSDLWVIIKEIVQSGSTILLTTQYLEEADALANHITIIDRGEKIADGTSSELKNTLGNNVIRFSTNDESGNIPKIIPGAIYDDATKYWTVKSNNSGASELITIAEKLVKHKIDVQELGIHRPSLDDVFLSLTGHRAEDQVDDKERAK